ncbi:hypothetical protein NQ314_013365 [Rhamnusium bicolor]|uniref:Glucosidase II subunit alpha n=1 Tax=Rhamnusium bicolor TaxID=1586634 RepID=A0AAV8X6V3_9CUCU|nr:hypothetical protein NQ314_013365 [Rhamnusium bicolor]
MPAEIDMIVNVDLLDVGERVFVSFGDIKIVLFTDPFNLTAFRDGREIVIINSRQLLTFEEHPNTEVALDFIFPHALRAYGLPEHAEKLSLRTTTNGSEPYRLYNIDRAGYEVNSPQGLYGSIPVLYALGKNITVGVFWQNSAQTFVDITNNETGIETYFMSESVAPLPQMFSLGHHQSRYSYMSQDEVVDVCNKFDENNFPLDVIWLDIDYTDKKKYFTWDPKTFSEPDSMLDSLNRKGKKTVAVIDPHIKREEGYFVFDECEEKGYFVQNDNGTTFEATCWPGLSSWIDFFNPNARNFYSSLIAEFAKNENLHIWNDMNEPSIFEAEEQAMDASCVHYDNWTHQDVHNQYGFYQTMGTYVGLLERSYKLRPFILTRSFFAGSQRFAAHWTGDNVASWEHLKISIPMILTEALAGLSFVGADVGGFTTDPTEELLQRWYQTGAWYPFFRAHSAVQTKRREPYLFNEEIKTRIRNALQQRYKHLTYWYTLFWEHYKTGEPVIRPLSYYYVEDVNTLDTDDEFLVGANILVHPVTDESAKNVTVYFPGGENELWYNIHDFNTTYGGTGLVNLSVTLDTVPVFYKGGSIIPIKQVPRNSSAYMKNDPITLLVFLDKQMNATGNIYDDDQISFDYLENKYTYVNFKFTNNTLSNEIIDKDARYNRPTILTSIMIYGLNIDIGQVYISKDTTTRSKDGIRISIDFQNMYVCGVTKNNKTLTIDNLNLDIRDQFIIKFDENKAKK